MCGATYNAAGEEHKARAPSSVWMRKRVCRTGSTCRMDNEADEDDRRAFQSTPAQETADAADFAPAHRLLPRRSASPYHSAAARGPDEEPREPASERGAGADGGRAGAEFRADGRERQRLRGSTRLPALPRPQSRRQSHPNKPDGYDEPHSQQTRISYESTAPVAAIMGPREQRVPAGSTISLKCVITSPYQTRPIKGVQWFRDNRLLTFQAARGGINVETVTGTAQTFTEATLANLTWRDTGKYSCRPTEGKSDTIALYVEDGEHSEAMQRDAVYAASAAAVRSAELISLFTTFLNIFLCSSIRKLAVFC
ncbi:uncharacterized protein LOC100115812 isoform X8 [Nasonia vitripennis]|uniref:Ig-like domain-containing protein n=1 Tax=Nasonia vitripennis TaxID=7425 RepID=A0A7M7QF15_NASVI|nr:uncharacterized protein LOC100115812 isoform X8 [Nasonia vitripennis]